MAERTPRPKTRLFNTPGTPAFFSDIPASQRIALGVLIVVLGGVLLSLTPVGIPLIAMGAWLTAGRGWEELRQSLLGNLRYVVRGLLCLAFFCAALYQAWFALLPTTPLFAISALLLPATRGSGVGWFRMPDWLLETMVAGLICLYANLLARVLIENAVAAQQSVISTTVQRFR